jgi:hypothetical protein
MAPGVAKHSFARPFRTYAVQVKIGFAGIGVDLATPLAQRLNVRIGGSFFSYNGTFNADGLNIYGDAKLRSGTLSVDWFPFNGRFRISPGLTLYNGNNLNAGVSVPAGGTFDLGDGPTYTSSASDPVHGTASLTFGKRTAPSLTMGWGNMIPRSGKHYSMPFEFGFQYIGDPLLAISLAGTACSNAGCSDVATDPTSQANLQQEVQELNSDLQPLRFYPIVSIGAAWKF